jgi:hypothetical protein
MLVDDAGRYSPPLHPAVVARRQRRSLSLSTTRIISHFLTHPSTNQPTHLPTRTTMSTFTPLSMKKALCQRYLMGDCDLGDQCKGAHPANLDYTRVPLAENPFSTVKGIACNRCLQRLLKVFVHINLIESIIDRYSATNQSAATRPTTHAPSAATSEVPMSRSAPVTSTRVTMMLLETR